MICGHHFHEDDFANKSKRDRLKKNALPKIFNHSQTYENDGIEENMNIAKILLANLSQMRITSMFNLLKVLRTNQLPKHHKMNQMNSIDRINCYTSSTLKKRQR